MLTRRAKAYSSCGSVV